MSTRTLPAIGLGCMRLSTRPDRDEARAIDVIVAALDAGATVLDTADVYCTGEADMGHNERLVAKALREWGGEARTITVATKGGLIRPGGHWRPDGRASQIRAACEKSLRALDVDSIDLYQLHAPDPRVPFETSVRALAALRENGMVRDVGLCNVTVEQIETARSITEITSVQVSLGPLDDENIRNGVAGYCREHALLLLAARPLGGDGIRRIRSDELLRRVAAGHGVTPEEISLAWLRDLGAVPLPGATQRSSAESIGRALAIVLADEDRARLDDRLPAGRQLRFPRALRQPPRGAAGEVVVVMGPPAAGKSSLARELVAQGMERLNRDEQGGRLADLITELDRGLAAGRRSWVLDNTYPTRAARNDVIECAWRHGVPVRCIHLETPIPEAQINAITRLIEAHGRLPMPEELKAVGRHDPRYFGPDAQFRWERQLERPVEAEGFSSVERRAFVRRRAGEARAGGPASRPRAAFFELDHVLCTSARDETAPALEPEDVRLLPGAGDAVHRYVERGWAVFGMAWRPQLAARPGLTAAVEASYERVRELLGVDLEIAHCPHPAGPPICWCRKPMPGLILQFALGAGIALEGSIIVGRSAADRTLADRLGTGYMDGKELTGADRAE